MTIRPDHISEDRWNALSDPQKQFEIEAAGLLSGQKRKFISHFSLLVQACFDKTVMSQRDVVNFPQADIWSIDQYKQWSDSQGIDFRSQIEKMNRHVLIVFLMDVIQFGHEEITDDVFRRILMKRLDDTTNYGLSLWRSLLKSHEPTIYEWWCIEGELAEELIAAGQFVLKNEYGYWWGRQSTGITILMDGTLQALVKRRYKEN